MNTKKSVICFGFLVIAGLYILAAPPRFFMTSSQDNASLSSTLSQEAYSSFEQALVREEDALFDLIETTTGITRSAIMRERNRLKKQIVKELRVAKKSSRKGIEPQVVALACEVLADFGFNPHEVVMLPGKSTAVCGARLMLCVDQLRSLPKEAARSILGHEAMHLRYEDDVYQQALINLCTRRGIDVDTLDAEHPYYRYIRFGEKRADIISCLNRKEYACGALLSLSHLKKSCGDDGYPSHPCVSDRLETVQQIVDAYRA